MWNLSTIAQLEASQSMAVTMSSTHVELQNVSLSLGENVTTRPQWSATNVTNRLTMGEMMMPKMDNMKDVFTTSCSLAVIFGGLVPYIPQYLKIKRSRSSEGFSTYVCLTLLLANVLRIAFWFGHHFEFPLLVQSFVMIIGMLTMMDICIRVRRADTGYIVSSIGVRPNTMRTRRRSLFGKILQSLSEHTAYAADYRDGLHNETTPIYSVTSRRLNSTSDGGSSYEDFVYVSIEPQNTSSEIAAYQSYESTGHEIPQSEIEKSQTATSNAPKSNGDVTGSSHERNESPILDSIQDGASSLEEVLNHSHSSHITRASNPDGNDGGQPFNQEETNLDKCLNAHYFWDWDDHLSYILFLLYFSLVLGLITYILLNNHVYIETLGFVAVFMESLLGVPQMLRNYKKKSTRGMSVEMVIMWLSGDIFKTLYFIFRQTPTQFIVCGSVQVVVDLIIIIQVIWYRRQVIYSRLPKST